MTEPTVPYHDRELFTWDGMNDIKDRCDAQAAKEGLTGVEAFFRSKALLAEILDHKPTYAQRAKAFREKALARQRDPLRVALEAIAKGHNDPRALAIDVLKRS